VMAATLLPSAVLGLFAVLTHVRGTPAGCLNTAKVPQGREPLVFVAQV
jgi:hypothetical protein